MQDAGSRIRHVSDDSCHLQAVHEDSCRFSSALHAEGNDTAGTVRHIFLRQSIIFTALQSGILHPGHFFMLFEIFRHSLCIFAMALHPQKQRLQADIQQKGVVRRRNRAQISHDLRGSLRDKCLFSESLGIYESVIGFIRLRHARKFVAVSHPVEFSGFDDGSAHAGGVSVHIFRSAVRHDIRTPLEGTAVYRRRERVIHDERYPVTVCRSRKFIEIQHYHGRIGDALCEDAFRIFLKGILQSPPLCSPAPRR